MDLYRGPQTALTKGLQRGLYSAIIAVRYRGHQTDLNIALYGSLYLATIMEVMEGPKLPLI
jgi:hypothetical protein